MKRRRTFRIAAAAAAFACLAGGVAADKLVHRPTAPGERSSRHWVAQKPLGPSPTDLLPEPTATPSVVATRAPIASRPVAAPPAPAKSAPPVVVPGPPGGMAVRVSGNHLVDGAGRPLVLRGVNFSGTEFMCTSGNGIYGGPNDSLSTYLAMRTWHANVVRVPMNEDCWLGINGVNPAHSGTPYQKAIETEVALIHQAGMYAILDLHFSAPGSFVSNGQATMADADHSPAFWASVSTAFKGDPATIFDLYNEPHPHDTELDPNGTDPWGNNCWRDGCAMTSRGGWVAAGMRSLIVAARSSGSTNPLLITGNGWGNDLSDFVQAAFNDPAGQLVAGLHSYPGQGCVLPDCWSNPQHGPLSTVAARFPIIIGETGDSANGQITYMQQELPSADSHGLSYLAWTWNPWQNPDDVLIKDWSGTPTTGEGAYYRSHLLSVQ